MVQVFGNRILGGIGAPGGGMSESFGAGVNTALNQRASRQAMVGEGQRQSILAQEQAFRIEDRAAAKKRQAAAEAAAATARARAAGLVAAQQRIFGAAPGGSGVAGLNLGAPAGTGRDRQGPAAPPSRATVPTAPVVPRNAPARSMGVEAPISGGAGRGVTGGAGSDQLAGVRAPTNRFDTPVGRLPGAGVRVSPIVAGRPDVSVGRLPVAAEPVYSNTLGVELSMDGQGKLLMNGERVPTSDPMYEIALQQYTSLQQNRQMTAAPVAPAVSAAPSAVGEPVFSDVFGALAVDGRGNLLVDNKVMPPSDPMYPAASRAYAGLQQRQVLAAGQAVLAAEQSPLVYADPLGYRTGVAGAQQALLGAQTAVGAAPNEYARFAGRSDAPVGGLPAAPTVTIQGPNGPVTVPTEEPAPATAPVAAAPAPAPADFTSPAQLRFGPDLGAPTRTSEEVMVDEFVSSIGVDPYAPPPIELGAPGQPGRAITDLLTQRDQQVQWAQALLDAEQYGDAQAVQDGIALIDAKLEAVVARQAIEEARDFNAPQRLNAIWSENKARNYEFVPVAPGVFDVYIDGQPQSSGVPVEQITQETLTMTDQVFAQQQAELAAKFAEAQAQAGGTAAGKAPFEAEAALLAADIAVTQAGLMTEIEVDRDMRIKLNDITKQRIEASLRTQGILPEQAREFKYVETDMGGVQIFDGDRLVVEYVPQESQRQDGSTFVTLAPVNQ